MTFEELNDDSYFPSSSLRELGREIWFSFFKNPVDELPYGASELALVVKRWFMEATWNNVYDFVEFVANHIPKPELFMHLSDLVMTREIAGFQFLDGRITPITSEGEKREVERAIDGSARPVAEHLSAALAFFSDRANPNYRKSVDESVLAVEAAARELSGKPKASLSDALKALKTDLHPALREAFMRLYGYTSDEGGIRHALTEDAREIDAGDAKYMLIACSAFVNYLRSKSKRELA